MAVSQSRTMWVKKGDIVNGKAVSKGYLAQYGKPEKKVTNKVKIVTDTESGKKAGETYQYKQGRTVGKVGKAGPSGGNRGNGGGGGGRGGNSAAQKPVKSTTPKDVWQKKANVRAYDAKADINRAGRAAGARQKAIAAERSVSPVRNPKTNNLARGVGSMAGMSAAQKSKALKSAQANRAFERTAAGQANRIGGLAALGGAIAGGAVAAGGTPAGAASALASRTAPRAITGRVIPRRTPMAISGNTPKTRAIAAGPERTASGAIPMSGRSASPSVSRNAVSAAKAASKAKPPIASSKPRLVSGPQRSAVPAAKPSAKIGTTKGVSAKTGGALKGGKPAAYGPKKPTAAQSAQSRRQQAAQKAAATRKANAENAAKAKGKKK